MGATNSIFQRYTVVQQVDIRIPTDRPMAMKAVYVSHFLYCQPRTHSYEMNMHDIGDFEL